MARFEFTVPALPDPDLRVRLDTAYDGSGVTVTDVLIGGRVADGAQGFDLRGVGTFLGPDGVDTLYAKLLDYRGTVVTAGIELDGAAAGGGGGGASEQFTVYQYTTGAVAAPLDGDNPLPLSGVDGAPVVTPSSGLWSDAVGEASPVACALLPAGAYMVEMRWTTNAQGGGEYAYAMTVVESVPTVDLKIGPAIQVPGTTLFVATEPTPVAVVVGADTADPDHETFTVNLTFVKVADAPA